MILTCPSCATSYFAPDEAIGPNGRRVRCKGCAQTWHATSDEPLELTATAAEPVTAEVVDFGKRDEAPESLAETPAPELPRAFRARAEQQRRLRRAATHGAVWAGLASVFVVLLSAAWLFRVDVVSMAPRTAAAYAMIGSPVNPTGLDFEAVTARAAPADPGKVLVSGALRNVRDREIVAPAVRLALLDASGAEVGHAVVRIDAAPVLPGGVQGFAALIPDPGAKAVGVGADFALDPPAAAAPQAAPAHPVSTRRPPQAPASIPAPTPVALRPALSADMGPVSDLPPMEAEPVSEPTNAAQAGLRLDETRREAVSASHHG